MYSVHVRDPTDLGPRPASDFDGSVVRAGVSHDDLIDPQARPTRAPMMLQISPTVDASFSVGKQTLMLVPLRRVAEARY